MEGREKEAAQELEASLQLAGKKERALAMHRAFERGGIKSAFEWELSEYRKKAAREYVSPLEFADVYARLKRKDEALHYLEDSYQERAPWLVHVQNSADFDLLHSEPRYQAIVRKMGLPAAQ